MRSSTAPLQCRGGCPIGSMAARSPRQTPRRAWRSSGFLRWKRHPRGLRAARPAAELDADPDELPGHPRRAPGGLLLTQSTRVDLEGHWTRCLTHPVPHETHLIVRRSEGHVGGRSGFENARPRRSCSPASPAFWSACRYGDVGGTGLGGQGGAHTASRKRKGQAAAEGFACSSMRNSRKGSPLPIRLPCTQRTCHRRRCHRPAGLGDNRVSAQSITVCRLVAARSAAGSSRPGVRGAEIRRPVSLILFRPPGRR